MSKFNPLSTLLMMAMTGIQVSYAEAMDYVVLLHGLGRSSKSFNSMGKFLTESGFHVVNIDYPSTKYDIQTLCDKYVKPEIDKRCTDKNVKINFVTHSLGGIICRYYLKQYHPENIGRVVMLAPPNHGSEVVDFLRDSYIITKIMGPAFEQLGTDPSSFVNMLENPKFDVGIIAGDKSFDLIGSLIISGPDDGKVSVARSKLDNAKDFLIVGRTHTFIMNAPEVKAAVFRFLKTGRFLDKTKPTLN